MSKNVDIPNYYFYFAAVVPKASTWSSPLSSEHQVLRGFTKVNQEAKTTQAEIHRLDLNTQLRLHFS